MADNIKQNQPELDLGEQQRIRQEKLKALQEEGKDPFVITKYDQTHHSADVKDNFDELEGKTVRVAGRMMSKRVMGKASFCNIQDLKGNIQSYVARDSIGEEEYKGFKKLDIGDIIGIEGEVFRTKTGEISIHATNVTLLSKSLQILPEKFHGLTNTDMRYRQRYIDLIMNQESKQTLINRSKIISAVRKYLDGEGFMEVETPMLVYNAGGAAARPFETHFNALDTDIKLRISLELYLKRLIVGGMERVYEIGRVFRNEGLDTRHNPEFTLMELYQAYTDYYGMMDLVEELYTMLAEKICGSTKITYQGTEIDLGHWERLTMAEAVKKYSGCDYYDWKTDEDARAAAKEKHVEVPAEQDILVSHDVIDNIEFDFKKEGIQLVIHLDPVVTSDEELREVRREIDAIVAIVAGELDAPLSIHDFRMVRGVKHTNLIFDVVVPFECKLSEAEICDIFAAKVRALSHDYNTVISVDRSYI